MAKLSLKNREAKREATRKTIPMQRLGTADDCAGTFLYLASDLRKVLGDRGLSALERLMGMILVIVSVEMLMQGVAQYLGWGRT